MKGIGRILVVGASDLLATYAMFVMTTYLTDVWKLGFTDAAAIMNAFWALVSVFPLFLKFMSDSVGSRSVLVISTIAYSVGMALLAMSTPPVLGNVLGSCTEYEPRCIGLSQRILFYTALLLIALGTSSHTNSFESFLNNQMNNANSILKGDDENAAREYVEETTSPQECSGICSATIYAVIAKIVAVFVLPYSKSWFVRFGVRAIFMLLATLIFVDGLSLYYFPKPEGSTLTRFFRVLVSASSKLFYPIPRDATELYEVQDDQLNYMVPHTNSLRCLDKAAIIVPTQPLEQQQNNKWRLCTVTEVEDTKKMVRLLPVCMTVILCGIVSSIGWTYFVEQLGHMNPKLGRFTISTAFILWFHQHAKDSVANFSEPGDIHPGGRKLVSLIRILVSMILATVCCITSAAVEKRRLGVVQEHGLVDKANETIPMTMLWLLPQFVLLGAFSGMYKSAAESFFKDGFPVAALDYLPSFIEALFGIGTLCSVASVYLVGKLSEMGGNKNWFQQNLNNSRLDKYFWTLACLMAINVVVFILAALWHKRNQPKDTQQALQEPLLS